jgi:phosphatidylglycerophosphatase C
MIQELEGDEDEDIECVAAFDFDGTLTKVDTLKLFLRSSRGPAAMLAAVGQSPVIMLRALFGGLSRDKAKEVMTRRLLAGLSEDELKVITDELVQRIMDRELRPDTVAWLEWHREAGHTIFVISASFEPYVRPVAERLGVSEVFSTRLEVDENGRLTGRLDGPNVRGPEKARILTEYTRSRRCRIYAYGDSRGDDEMLGMADVAKRARRTELAPPDQH